MKKIESEHGEIEVSDDIVDLIDPNSMFEPESKEIKTESSTEPGTKTTTPPVFVNFMFENESIGPFQILKMEVEKYGAVLILEINSKISELIEKCYIQDLQKIEFVFIKEISYFPVTNKKVKYSFVLKDDLFTVSF